MRNINCCLHKYRGEVDYIAGFCMSTLGFNLQCYVACAYVCRLHTKRLRESKVNLTLPDQTTKIHQKQKGF